jgi:hypothetical protein
MGMGMGMAMVGTADMAAATEIPPTRLPARRRITPMPVQPRRRPPTRTIRRGAARRITLVTQLHQSLPIAGGTGTVADQKCTPRRLSKLKENDHVECN